MNNKWITFLMGVCITVSSCEETPPASEFSSEISTAGDDFIIFGHFYGFCGGEECIEIFKLTSSDLYEDTHDFYPSSEKSYNGKFELLDRSKFDRIKNYTINIPDDLLSETNKVIGSPDAADGGGIYLELSSGQYWLIDMNKDYLPAYLHDLRDQVEEVISKVNE